MTYVISEPQNGYQEFCFDGDQYLYVNTSDSKKPLLLVIGGQYTEQDSIIQLDSNLPTNERFNGSRIKRKSIDSIVYKDQIFLKRKVEMNLFDGIKIKNIAGPTIRDCTRWTEFVNSFTTREFNFHDSIGNKYDDLTIKKTLKLRESCCKYNSPDRLFTFVKISYLSLSRSIETFNLNF